MNEDELRAIARGLEIASVTQYKKRDSWQSIDPRSDPDWSNEFDRVVKQTNKDYVLDAWLLPDFDKNPFLVHGNRLKARKIAKKNQWEALDGFLAYLLVYHSGFPTMPRLTGWLCLANFKYNRNSVTTGYVTHKAWKFLHRIATTGFIDDQGRRAILIIDSNGATLDIRRNDMP